MFGAGVVHSLDALHRLGELCSVMGGKLRSIRLLAVVLLFLCALAPRADAQQFVCRPIAPGDTASSLARRLMGSAAAAYGDAFQIRDPARRMFVPKSHYLRLQSEWQACVAAGPVRNTPVAYAPEVLLATAAIAADEAMIAPAARAASASVSDVHAGRTISIVTYAATVGAAGLVIMWLSAVGSSLVLRPMPAAVRRAGEDFVAVFAQPLNDPSSEVPPIQTRLRFVRRKQQLEISIAPGPGHCYPNLADHKKNLEYDVDRVMRVLGNYALTGYPRAAGRWVVVTIQPSISRGASPPVTLAVPTPGTDRGTT